MPIALRVLSASKRSLSIGKHAVLGRDGPHAIVACHAISLEHLFSKLGRIHVFVCGQLNFSLGNPCRIFPLSIGSNYLGRCGNRLSLIGIVEARRAPYHNRGRNILIGKRRIIGIVGIAFDVARKLLTGETRRDRYLRIVFGLGDKQILMLSNARPARFELVIGGFRSTRQFNRNNTRMPVGLFAGVAPVGSPFADAINHLGGMKIPGYSRLILPIKNALCK